MLEPAVNVQSIGSCLPAARLRLAGVGPVREESDAEPE